MRQAKLDLADRQNAVLTALGSQLSGIESGNPGSAVGKLCNGEDAFVRWGNDWCVIRTPLCFDRASASLVSFDRAQNALHLNAVCGQGRYVAVEDGADLALIAEYPLFDIPRNDFDTLHARTVSACAALQRQLQHGPCQPDGAPLLWDAGDDAGDDVSIRALLEDAGWSATSGQDQCSRVELELPRGNQQAVAELRDDHVFLTADVLDDTAGVSRDSVYAASLYLLRCVDDVRLVSATADLREKTFFPRLQAVLPRSAEWLRHGLSALSVAYGMTSGQVEILSGSESIARRFLEMRKLPAPQ